jgi:hypothetical protein
MIESQRFTVQQIDAIKAFLLSSMDFMPLNGDVGKRQLETMDKHIRASINNEIKGQTLASGTPSCIVARRWNVVSPPLSHLKLRMLRASMISVFDPENLVIR